MSTSFCSLFSPDIVRYVYDAWISLVENDTSLLSQTPRELRKLLPADMPREIARAVQLPETLDELVKRFRVLEKGWFESVFHGLDKDNQRGREIFDDYDSAHPVDSAFVEWERARFEESVKRLANVLKSLG